MNDSWDEMRRVKEEEYFQKKNQEAVERLKTRTGNRPSPITGKPMEQITIMGIVVDRCNDSGGIWLDAGELESILKASEKAGAEGSGEGFLSNLFSGLFSKKY